MLVALSLLVLMCVPSHQATVPTVRATIVTAEWCIPCRRYIAAVKKELPADGWTVRDATAADAAKAHIVITNSVNEADKIERYPTTIIRRHGTEVARIVGYVSPTTLAETINRFAK